MKGTICEMLGNAWGNSLSKKAVSYGIFSKQQPPQNLVILVIADGILAIG
jgi:hypothetical protein